MECTWRRYTDVAFPSYRYVPREQPHPVTDPRGHSYRPPGATPEPPAVLVRPEEWRRSQEYLYGCDLHNHAYWWEAHEAWESLWHVADRRGPQGHLLQGLIQVATCHLKLRMGNLRGVRSLRGKYKSHLRRVLDAEPGPRFMGLDVRAWLRAVEGYYERRLLGDPEGAHHDPAAFPYIVLDG